MCLFRLINGVPLFLKFLLLNQKLMDGDGPNNKKNSVHGAAF